MVTPRTAIWAPNWPPAKRATGIDAARYHGESFMLRRSKESLGESAGFGVEAALPSNHGRSITQGKCM